MATESERAQLAQAVVYHALERAQLAQAVVDAGRAWAACGCPRGWSARVCEHREAYAAAEDVWVAFGATERWVVQPMINLAIEAGRLADEVQRLRSEAS